MSLKSKIESLDGIDDALKAHYKQTDNGYVLDVEGGSESESVSKLESALRKEREIKKELESKLSRYGGKSPDDINAILDEMEAIKAGAKFDPKNLPESEREALVKEIVEARTKKFERQLADMTAALEAEKGKAGEYETKLTMRELESMVMGYLPGKVVDTAFDDAVAIARMSLKRNPDDGKFYAEDGTDSERWLAAQIEKRPHWQKGSHSAGAKGGASSPESSKKNWIEGVFPK